MSLMLAACHAQQGTATPQPQASRAGEHSQAGTRGSPGELAQRNQAELEARFNLAVTAFDGGAYQLAADLFAQTLLQVEPLPSGDGLRHLLIQHVAWSLLGAYDVYADAAALERGAVMLERYIVKHEALRPMATSEREVIYELLAEYDARLEGQAPAQVNEHLRELTFDTARSIQGQARIVRRRSSEDTMVRIVEVDRVDWGERDDPGVRRFHQSLRYSGPSLFERSGDAFNPTRVLVRGWVTGREGLGDGRLAMSALRTARPALERCYERALVRGAGIVERTRLDLRWGEGDRGAADFAAPPRFDARGRECILAALEGTAFGDAADSRSGAQLHLTFFVQPERRPDRGTQDYNYIGGGAPPSAGDINRGAQVEDVSVGISSVQPLRPGSPRQRGVSGNCGARPGC